MWNRTTFLGGWRSALYIFFGTGLVALGGGAFLAPFNIVAGGMSGIAIAVVELMGVPYITVDLLVGVLSVFFFILGALVFGDDFTMKTLLSSLVYPPLFYLSGVISSSDFLYGYFNLASHRYSEISLVLAAILGGVLVGAGCALSFKGGGSSGGVDVLALTMSRLIPGLKSSRAMLIIDATVILFGAIAVGDFILTALGIISATVSSLTLDRVLLGEGRGVIAHIITQNPRQIRRRIIETLNRTTTELDCVGGYTHGEKTLVIVSVSAREFGTLMAIVSSEDPTAFLTVHHASEIRGEGWKSLS